MRIFLDECIDWRLMREISGHEVRTARQMGWASMTNGALLALVSQQFDVFVTIDQNLSYQQNLRSIDLSVIVLRVRTSRLADLQRLAPQLLDAIASTSPGSVVVLAE